MLTGIVTEPIAYFCTVIYS